jgi:hypothetical protein
MSDRADLAHLGPVSIRARLRALAAERRVALRSRGNVAG